MQNIEQLTALAEKLQLIIKRKVSANQCGQAAQFEDNHQALKRLICQQMKN